jgi:hypothetical protein
MTIAWTGRDERPLPPPAGKDGWLLSLIMVVWIVVTIAGSTL